LITIYYYQQEPKTSVTQITHKCS